MIQYYKTPSKFSSRLCDVCSRSRLGQEETTSAKSPLRYDL